jgi:hypothetical protein
MLASTVLMVRPASFGSNLETLQSNTFQQPPEESDDGRALVKQKGREEFDRFVQLLNAAGVDVVCIDDTEEPQKYVTISTQ